MDTANKTAPAEALKLGIRQPAPDGRPASDCSALEERLTFLRGGSTERLLSLLGETLSTDACMTPDYFLLAMDPRFRTSQTAELFDMLTTVLRERLPNAGLSHGDDSATPTHEKS